MKLDIEGIRKWADKVTLGKESCVIDLAHATRIIPEILAEIEALRAKLAAADADKEKLRYALLCEVDHAKQVLMIVDPLIERKNIPIEEIAGMWKDESLQEDKEAEERPSETARTLELQEKLALSEAAGAEMQEALKLAKSSIEDPSNGGLNETMYKVFEKALASDHGKAYLEVVRAAEDFKEKDDAYISSGLDQKLWEPGRKAKKGLFYAIDRLPGKGE